MFNGLKYTLHRQGDPKITVILVEPCTMPCDRIVNFFAGKCCSVSTRKLGKSMAKILKKMNSSLDVSILNISCAPRTKFGSRLIRLYKMWIWKPLVYGTLLARIMIDGRFTPPLLTKYIFYTRLSYTPGYTIYIYFHFCYLNSYGSTCVFFDNPIFFKIWIA